MPGAVPPDIDAAALAPAARRRPVSRPRSRRAYDQLRLLLQTASATPSRWRRARRRCTGSRIRPSAWPPGCSTTTPAATSTIARAFVDGAAASGLTRDDILDNITLYWLTNTGVSSARLYWENKLGVLRRQGRHDPGRPSASSPTSSTRLRGAGPSRPTPTSSTTTSSTRAATSPPGSSRSSSRPRCARRSVAALATGGRHEHHRRHSHRDPPVPASRSRTSSSTTCAGASRRRAGPARSSSTIGRRACSWRRCRSSPATGRPSTTGASARRG